MHHPHLTVLLLVIVGVTFAKGQSVLGPTGYNRIGSEYWASGGAGIAEREVHAIALENPALLSFTSPTLTLESGWRPETFMYRDSYDKTILAPSYVSIGIPLAPWTLEVGYAMPYNEHVYLGGSSFSITDGQNVSDVYYDWIVTNIIRSAFGAVSYTFTDNSSLGFATQLDFVRYNNDFLHQQEATGTMMEFTFGGVTSVSERIHIGFAAHASTDRYLHYTIRFAPTGYVLTAANLATGGGTMPTYPAKSPPWAEIGTNVQVTPWLKLLGSVEFQNWHSTGNYMSNRWQYHAGAVASLNRDITLRAGYFTMWSPYPINTYYDDQFFLTAGASWRFFSGFTATIAYQTSAPFTRRVLFIDNTSSDSFQQQVLSGGVAYSW